ncbi:hypothetical protein SAMD00019534_062340 [Acytostelium subglobosum LB1]|uniref:hypothetical protein n=1 Tax=Acytostelium subglobosum LB1 TaxID=1410327 RepID=UPI0006448559|nr:hypothetical protein SAMD00019534_062340 [Acytostelium subglobosum LB1]GAM23059.1 hypothetical protein SAMD00019534_062340 [Acytostelium subglobosum LB1]|eukprot:XP_012754286.1 hypothetical protein SAMD00019534_062340 [Acytostelium subglobosum LB1]
MGYYEFAEMLEAAAGNGSSSSGGTDSNKPYTCKDTFPTEDVVLGILLGIGIFISFLPQILVLIIRKNIEGLSLISCWFNYVNCMGTFLNVLFLNWFAFACCHDYMTEWVCFQNLIPVSQLGVPFVTTGVIFALYVIYRPILPPFAAVEEARRQQKLRLMEQTQKNEQAKLDGDTSSPTTNNDNKDLPFVEPVTAPSEVDNSKEQQTTTGNDNDEDTSSSSSDDKKKDKKKKVKGEIPPDSFLLKDGDNKIERFFIRMDWYSVPFFWGSMAASLIFFLIGLGLVLGYGAKSDIVSGYAYAMGIMASVLVFLQWLPQIYTTWISDKIGSLSLVSLCIQIPGAILICYNQLSLGQSWTTWFPYLATAVQEIVLLGICVYYLIRDRKKRKREKKEKEERDAKDSAAAAAPPGENSNSNNDNTSGANNNDNNNSNNDKNDNYNSIISDTNINDSANNNNIEQQQQRLQESENISKHEQQQEPESDHSESDSDSNDNEIDEGTKSETVELDKM